MSQKFKRLRGLRPLAEDQLARVSCHGAAGEVTGSCFLIETRKSRLLVECGMFQGARREESRNRRAFPFTPSAIDHVLLTHAHIDHSGLLPKLVADGFRGAVHATRGTCDLLRILLPDSAHIHQEDAKHATRKSLRRGGKPKLPLYTSEDAEAALARLEEHPFHTTIELAPDLEVRFHRAGHILGASSLEVSIKDGSYRRILVFSGDVGRTTDPLLRDPEAPERADLLFLESTYGSRDHRSTDESIEEFAEVLRGAAQTGENVLLPSFAVGRSQELLYTIAKLEQEGRIPSRPVYMDSPMAIHVTELYPKHSESFETPIRSLRDLEPRELHLCRTPEESIAINAKRGVIILSASGMCDAGRIVHHLKHNLWRAGSHVVIAGFQARGTRGRALVQGARHVRIHGEKILVRARVHTIGGFSAHAGQSELVSWGAPMISSGAAVALVHGEEEAREGLKERLVREGSPSVYCPHEGDRFLINRRGPAIGFEPGQ